MSWASLWACPCIWADRLLGSHGPRRRLVASVMVLVVLGFSSAAAAQDELGEEERLQSQVVQDREHHWHEFNASLGLLPLDAFLKGFTVTGTYALHFTPLFGWEIGQFKYVFANSSTDLNDDLRNVGVPNSFRYVQWSATSNLIFKPFYGKFSLFNRTQLFLEVFVNAGAGYGWLTGANRSGHSQHLTVDVGGGAHVYFGQYFSLRFDLRWEGFFLNLEEPHHELWIALGVAVHFG